MKKIIQNYNNMLLNLKEQYNITLNTKNHIRFNIKKSQKKSINHCKQFLIF